MASKRVHELSSALLQVRFLRAVLPYVIFLMVIIVVWDGLLEGYEARALIAFVGFWVVADVVVRYADRRARSVTAELLPRSLGSQK